MTYRRTTAGGSGINAPDRLDPFEREIIRLVLSWAPYGGPPDEITLPEFGVSAALLVQRFRAIIKDQRRRPLHEYDRQLIWSGARMLKAQPMSSDRPTERHESSAKTDYSREDLDDDGWFIRGGVRHWTSTERDNTVPTPTGSGAEAGSSVTEGSRVS